MGVLSGGSDQHGYPSKFIHPSEITRTAEMYSILYGAGVGSGAVFVGMFVIAHVRVGLLKRIGASRKPPDKSILGTNFSRNHTKLVHNYPNRSICIKNDEK